MNFNKKFTTFLAVGILLIGISIQAQAANNDVSDITDASVSSTNIEYKPMGDIIVKKYRTHNGKRQYRRWNQTRNKWVDSNWIDMPGQ